jgi:hypothetical protein
MVATDAYLRVTKFAGPMLKGERGDPDMSNQGRR